ncbi:MAG TPA: transglutaminase family protein, partial [Kofleriaceae bacterium]|nr:transglutaminase family protein [Kofleriaceae bacterium]
ERAADRGEKLDLLEVLAPLLGDRSELVLRSDGGIELPAIRMPERPEMVAALAALFRSIVARLVVAHYREPLIDWHDELHDRFALPAALHRDLRLVLGDLDEHGLGVPAQLRCELEAWRTPPIACRLGEATLELRPALEFGAGAGQTQRWEIAIDGVGPDRVVVAGRWATLRDLGGGVRAIGVLRRVHEGGLAPVIDPLVIEWAWAGRAQRIELWASRPGGETYSEPPRDATDAQRRRTERISVTSVDGGVEASRSWRETNPFTIDLRRVTIDA